MAGRGWSVAFFACCLMAASGAAAECRIALALALDVSRSVDGRDYAIQRDGLVAALTDPDIRAAILGSPDHVALAIYEWSSKDEQRLMLDWTEITDATALDRIVAGVALHTRAHRGNLTALGAAVAYGADLMQRAPACADQVLDVSGDGQNNDGIDPRGAYAARAFGPLRVNGLAIRTYEHDVAEYYRSRVIRGAGAFVEVAEGQNDFPRAIRRKLLRELGPQVLGRLSGTGAGPG